MTDPLTVIPSDALRALEQIANESVQCVVTSPPYWSLRDYGIESIVWDAINGCKHKWGEPQTGRVSGGGDRPPDNKWKGVERTADKAEARYTCVLCGAWKGCLGLEPTPELYVQHIVKIFREVKRVLRKDGTLWLNLGDSYASGKVSCFNPGGGETSLEGHAKLKEAGAYKLNRGNKSDLEKSGLKPKDLIGIPWRVAFALQADGWYLRSDIIWSKPNPMPESVTDRPTKSHEYIFLLTKSKSYYYDAEAIKEPIADSSVLRINQPNFENQTGGEKDYSNGTNPNRSARRSLENFAERIGREDRHSRMHQSHDPAHKSEWNGKHRSAEPQAAARRIAINSKAARDAGAPHEATFGAMRNKRSVWEIATAPFPEAHFATFPKDLVIPCVLAGSKSGDTILDPFGGSGTVGKVAIELGRQAVLIEPNPQYVTMIEKRCATTIGLPL